MATEGTITVTTNVTGAAVEILDGATPVATGSTLSGYTYTTNKIKYGTYVVTVKREGYKDFTQTVVLNADDAKVDAKLESVNEVKAELKDAYKANDTLVQVNFTNKIAVPTKDNFSIEGLTVTDAKITADQKSVLLTVAGMELDKTYTVKTKNIVDANGKAVADGSVDFTARKISYKAEMNILDVNGNSITTIKSDGKETAKFEVILKDDAGNIIKGSKAEVRFTTTAGNFAETKVSAQNGVAANIFTSEISSSPKEALITATVVASDIPDLINVETTRRFIMTPDVNVDNKGASLTDVMVDTCDRVVLYFNKDVNVTDYTVGGKDKYAYDAKKMEIKIANNAGTFKTITDYEKVPGNKAYTPKALAPVPGNSKALYAILDVDDKGEYLTDNANTIVEITDKTKSVPTTESKIATVTDIRTPSMLSVTNPNESLKTIEITFSEPVQNNKNGKYENGNSAEVLKKWVIDNVSLDNEKYGTGVGNETLAKATVGKFDEKTGADNRNKVTITLGKDSDGNQIYFKAGKHSVQGNNIGDWANVTDTANNLINTQTLDFVIKANEKAPEAIVTPESPEQFDLKFNTPIEINNPTAGSSKVTELRKALKLQQKVDNEWKDVSGNPIVVRDVYDADGNPVGDEYIVELTKDWTKILDTNNTKKNYYNYNFRLHMDKEIVKNASNGLKNAEMALDLTGSIMTNPDVTSAELTKVTRVDGEDAVLIDISEPVQIAVKDENGKLNRTLTPKDEQKDVLSDPIVQFISSGDKETIQGRVVGINDHDNQIKVVPNSTVSTGTWKVVVRNVSDDVGNTSATLVYPNFVVDKPIVSTDFEVLWVVGVKANTAGPVGQKENHDVIYVKFNKKIKTYDGVENAGATTNYTINGYSVPTTSKIDRSVYDYNEKAVIKNDYSDIVAIHLTDKTLTDTSNTINISNTLKSATDDQLGNGGLKILTDYKSDTYHHKVFTWNYGTCNPGTVTLSASDLQKFLNDGQYKDYDLSNVTISDADKATLTIKHTSDVTFATNTTVKELVIDTQETGKLKISNIKAGKVIVNAPNADVTLNGVNVDTNTGGTAVDAGTLEVKDILEGTLTLEKCAIDNLKITDANKGAVAIENGTTIKKMEIDTKGDITLDVADGIKLPDVDVKQDCKINVVNNSGNTINFKVANSVKADDVKITASGKSPVIATTTDKDGKTTTIPTKKVVTLSKVEKPEDVTTGSAFSVTTAPVSSSAISKEAVVGTVNVTVTLTSTKGAVVTTSASIDVKDSDDSKTVAQNIVTELNKKFVNVAELFKVKDVKTNDYFVKAKANENTVVISLGSKAKDIVTAAPEVKVSYTEK